MSLTNILLTALAAFLIVTCIRMDMMNSRIKAQHLEIMQRLSNILTLTIESIEQIESEPVQTDSNITIGGRRIRD